MEYIRSVVMRYPQRELDIRRLCARDERFRSICQDYQVAEASLRHWQETAPEAVPQVEDYRSVVNELEEEILAYLDSASIRMRK